MSFVEIQAELEKLTSDELRQLALKSRTAFLEKEDRAKTSHECSEEDSTLLTSLDDAIEKADSRSRMYSGNDVRARLKQWTSK